MSFNRFKALVEKNEGWRLATPLAVLLWLLMCGIAVGKAANDAFFIATAGADQLPYVLIINALLLGVGAFFYSLFERLTARFRLFVLILLFFLLTLALLRGSFAAGADWLPFALFGYHEFILLIVVMHFWTCANDIFDPRAGKQFFPYIGGIGILGSISGGLIAGLTAPIVGLENLFIIWMGLLALAIPATIWAWRTCGDRIPAFHFRERFDFRLLRDYPLVSILAWIGVPLWLVVHTVDWLFYLAMAETFPDDSDKLSAFLGFLGGAVSLGGLLLQFLVSGPLMRRKGVPFAFAIYAFSMTLGAFLLGIRALAGPSSALLMNLRTLLAIVTRFLDESVLHSIFESSRQLLYGALPTAIRGQARALVNGMVEPAMTAISGLFLIFAASMELDRSILAFSVTAVGISWIFLTLKVRPHYLQTLLSNLSSRDINQRQLLQDQMAYLKLDAHIEESLLSSLLSKDNEVALLSLDYLQRYSYGSELAKIVPLLDKMQPRVLVRSLELLAKNKDEVAIPHIRKLLDHPEPTVCAAALQSLANLLPGQDRELYQKYLDSDWQSVRAAAITSILNSQQRWDTNDPAYRALRKMVLSSNSSQNIYAAHIIADLSDQSENSRHSLSLLTQLLDKKDSGVCIEATRALGYIQSKQSITTLLKLLIDPQFMYSASSSLVKLGSYATPHLHEELMKLKKNSRQFGDHEETFKSSLILCLGRIASTESMLFLQQFLSNESEEIEDTALNALIEIKKVITAQEESDQHRAAKAASPKDQKNLAGVLKGAEEAEGAEGAEAAKRAEGAEGAEGAKEAEGVEGQNSKADGKKGELLFPEDLAAFSQVRFWETIRQLDHEYKLLGHLRGLKQQKEIGLLVDALESSAQRSEQRSIKYLILLSQKKEIQAAMSALRGFASRQRSEAIEAMEGYGSDSSEIATILDRFAGDDDNKGEQKIASSQADMQINDLFRSVLDQKQSPWIIACALFTIARLQLKGLASLIVPLKRSDNPLIYHNAANALVNLGYHKHLVEVQNMSVDMERVLFLRTVPLFSDIDGYDLQWISEIAVEKDYRSGSQIFKEGERGDELYVVMSGNVRIFKGNLTVAILNERECFGEMAIIDGDPRSASAEAESDVKLLGIHRNDFDRLIMNQPRIALALFKNASRRLREALGKLNV